MSAEPSTRAKPLGNLSSMLSSYEQSKKESTIEDQILHTTSLPLDLVTGRDRGFTFGSEFDLGFENLDGNLVLDNDSIHGDAGPASQRFKDNKSATVSMSESTADSSINNKTKQTNDSDTKSQQNLAPENNNNRNIPSPGSSQSSTTGMLSGYFGTSATTTPSMKIPNGDTVDESDANFEYDFNDEKKTQNTVVAHTPPSIFGTSYELNHFRKRMRAGSISGRVRAMSDLQEKGIIDRNQRNILKDLIITGDDALQSALDLYEKGDSSQLEDMIKSGALQNKESKEIDLLEELDLDFLTMTDTNGENHLDDKEIGNKVAMETIMSMPQSVFKNDEQLFKSNPSFQAQRTIHLSTQNIKTEDLDKIASNQYQDDGIGDLIFNGEFSDTEEFLSLPTGKMENSSLTGATNSTTQSRSRSTSAVDLMRFRANSLAFGGLLDEPTSDNSFGKWMDRSPILETNDNSKYSTQKRQGMNGKNKTARSQSQPMNQMIGQNGSQFYVTSNDFVDGCNIATSTNTKSQQAILKRIQREGKKAEKERKKQEKKEKKEQELKIKKAKEAKEKQQKKEMRAALAKMKADDKRKKKGDSQALTTLVTTPPNASDSQKDLMAPFQEISDEPTIIESGTGRPRSLSDPNLSVGLDKDGLMHVDRPDGWVGAYSPDSRKIRIERFLEKRNHRVWTKKVKYDVRKNFADSRLRVKGRFVKKEDELLMRDLMSLT